MVEFRPAKKLTAAQRTIQHDGQRIEFTVKRSRRRTVALRVDPSGAVFVHAPLYVWGPFIDRFVRRNIPWILRKRAYFDDVTHRPPQRHFLAGETVPAWGAPRAIESLVPLKSPAETRQALIAWYRQELNRRLPGVVALYSGRLGVHPHSITVANQISRWGSCSLRGDLRFSWRLAALPEAMLDYVVIHEVAHLKELNHSARFWALVQSLLPDYKEKRKWLRQNALRYSL